MERREFITTLGAVAVAASASSAIAEEAAKAAGGVHHMHPALYKALSSAAAKCVAEAIIVCATVLACSQ